MRIASSAPAGPVSSLTLEKLPYIDCVRGYAIGLVMTCHAAYLFPDLPYPVHRIAVAGWFGVQLFFLASCVTLLRSWNNERDRNGTVRLVAFFLRRLFRIAPAYYFAALGYTLFDPGYAGYSIADAVRTLSFTNALDPRWTARTLVPGGWSVGAEFTFYAVFPLFALVATSMRRAVLVFGASVVLGSLCNLIASARLDGSVAPLDMDNGLFFWFPNQACVFALGGIVYGLVCNPPALLRRYPTGGCLIAVGAFWAATRMSLPHSLGQSILPPSYLAVSVAFGLAIVSLSAGARVFVNRLAAAAGRVSFSAYLIHFAVIDALGNNSSWTHAGATGLAAIAAFAVVLPIVGLITYAVSCVTYRCIELPMIGLAGSIVRRRRAVRAT